MKDISKYVLKYYYKCFQKDPGIYTPNSTCLLLNTNESDIGDMGEKGLSYFSLYSQIFLESLTTKILSGITYTIKTKPDFWFPFEHVRHL